MATFNFYQKKKEDKIVYGDGIVDGIILLAVSELSKVELYSHKASNKKKKTNAIKVNFSKDGLEIDVFVKIHYSQSVSDVAFKIQETIRHNIESMTDYHIKHVNVNVVGVFFEDKNIVVPVADNTKQPDVKPQDTKKEETTEKTAEKK